ncbi:metallophosphoesterase family protein [Maribellus sp. YY47]|uniref:purple acid phosphatase family protein n=1 Tax=Maribellus sp. YY47 TaxID=2929486 RepID=UPI00200123FF|nr:metallophosphoesterase family protein [Maribellus sp. YY47]MCK3683871.1 metallophosphoesterase family protein [Maribellus sp. YY47]
MNRAITFPLLSFFLSIFSLAGYAQEVNITHGPYIQALGENEATIVWTTDSNAVSWVEVAPAGDDSFYASERPKYYQTSNGNRVVGTLHKIKIAGLKKGTEYRYRIFSKAVRSYEGHRVLYGNIASSNVYSKKPLRFSTLDKDKKTISFLMLNDIHSRVDDLKNLSGKVEYGKTDLVIFNGDMVSSMNDETQFFSGFMDDAVTMFAGEVPMYYCRGNHETRGKFSVNFPEYFPTNTGKLYYSFRQGPVYFIVLDGGEDKPDSDIEYSGLAQFDAYRSEQQQWLKELIKTEDFKTAKYKVVLIHIPPAGSTWHGPNDIRNKFLPVLNGQGVTAMLCGHLHSYEYLKPEPGLYDFPIIINAHNTSLEVNADLNSFSILRKSTDGETLEKLTF